MIRILTADGVSGTTLTIDGRLIGEYADEVDAAVRRTLEQGKPVRLFLRNVFDIDTAGRSLLSRLAAQGIELAASGVYSAYVVANIGK